MTTGAIGIAFWASSLGCLGDSLRVHKEIAAAGARANALQKSAVTAGSLVLEGRGRGVRVSELADTTWETDAH